MEENENKSEIENFESKLNAKRKKPEFERTELHQKKYNITRDFGDSTEAWSQEEESDSTPHAHKGGSRQDGVPGLLKKFLLASIAFFIIAIAVAGYFVYTGSNVISTDKIEISVAGPKAVRTGEDVLYQIAVTNNNSTTLEDTQLFVTFPDGTRQVKDMTKTLTTDKESLGDILSGGTKTIRVDAAFVGNVHDKKNIEVKFVYHLSGGSAAFVKKLSYPITISSSPIAMNVEVLHASPADHEVTLTLTVHSNADDPIKDLVVEGNYPRKFSFQVATPTPDQGNTIWKVGTLNPGESKTFTVKGVITGATKAQEVFKFTAGASGGVPYGVGIPYSEAQAETTIELPFISAKINLSDAGYLSSSSRGLGGAIEQNNQGEKIFNYSGGSQAINGTIDWANNVPSKITNLQFTLEAKGSLVDRSTIKAGSGFYDSASNTLLWSGRTNSKLSIVSAGASGSMDFNFNLYQPFSAETSAVRNPTITLELSAAGNRLSEAGVAENLQAYFTKKIKVATVVDLSSYITHFTSPFENTGPMPPRVGQKTTYTVFWTLKNAFNDVSGATVSAKLPPYVSWVGKFSPENQNIEYNPYTGVVTWHLGELKAGAGIQAAARQVAFQIALSPSTSQVGSLATLVGPATFQGTDTFTETPIKKGTGALTTNLTNDADFSTSMQLVHD